MRRLIIGDPHLRFMPPARRTNDFYNNLIDKLKQIEYLANKYNVDEIDSLGDFFDSFVIEHLEKIIWDIAPIMKSKKWKSLIGNHDSKSSNGELSGTSFGVLFKLGILDVLNSDDNIDVFHYYKRKEFNKINTKAKIAFIHENILPKGKNDFIDPINPIDTKYNFVFCGHYHDFMDITVGKTRYINPGSITRLTIADSDYNRIPKVIFFDDEKNICEIIDLKVKPKEEVYINDDNVTSQNLKFESKFVNMLKDSKFESNSIENILNILRKNNVEEKYINYIKSKSF